MDVLTSDAGNRLVGVSVLLLARVVSNEPLRFAASYGAAIEERRGHGYDIEREDINSSYG
jgi:hypothetical protein